MSKKDKKHQVTQKPSKVATTPVAKTTPVEQPVKAPEAPKAEIPKASSIPKLNEPHFFSAQVKGASMIKKATRPMVSLVVANMKDGTTKPVRWLAQTGRAEHIAKRLSERLKVESYEVVTDINDLGTEAPEGFEKIRERKPRGERGERKLRKASAVSAASILASLGIEIPEALKQSVEVEKARKKQEKEELMAKVTSTAHVFQSKRQAERAAKALGLNPEIAVQEAEGGFTLDIQKTA